ncbi:MAG TPA: ABC transporter permease [Blastocatellia bacterium]|nr:ABC transporter permease [Blastocatellia bacterium]
MASVHNNTGEILRGYSAARVVAWILGESLRTVWRFRLRSGLILSISMLGIAGVIASVDYASGGREQVLDQIRRMGTNVLIVTAKQSRSVGGRARTGAAVTTLVQPDYVAIRRNVPEIRRSSALVTGTFRLKAGDFSKTCTIVGCEPDYARIRNWPVEEGFFFDESDERRLGRVAVLGRTVAKDLFGGASSIGKRLLINRIPFEVVAVMRERGQGLDTANEDNQVYVPLATSMHRLLNVDYYNGLVFELDRWEEMDSAASAISGVLHQRHWAVGRAPDDFQVQNQKGLVDAQIASAEKLGFFVRWIGISGLIVSGIGTLAIYWIAVKERTVEVGIRRAAGATAPDIFFQILFESALLSSAGSIIGVAAGWQCSNTISSMVNQPFVFDRENVLLALAVSLSVNLAFALLPSAKAARLDPIQALKYE